MTAWQQTEAIMLQEEKYLRVKQENRTPHPQAKLSAF